MIQPFTGHKSNGKQMVIRSLNRRNPLIRPYGAPSPEGEGNACFG